MPLIGVISDTHGLLRPEAVVTLRGVGAILYAGDIGGADIIAGLSRIAPVTVVRGNNDRGDWARRIPHRRLVEIGGIPIYMLHDLKELDPAPAVPEARVVIAGHSHKPVNEEREESFSSIPGVRARGGSDYPSRSRCLRSATRWRRRSFTFWIHFLRRRRGAGSISYPQLPRRTKGLGETNANPLRPPATRQP